jgi:hypothetical protein
MIPTKLYIRLTKILLVRPLSYDRMKSLAKQILYNEKFLKECKVIG